MDDYNDLWNLDRQDYVAIVTELRAELAQARAKRDEAMKQRDFAKDGEDNMRFLKVLWENECGFYRAQSVARLHEIDLGRRTIRALVVVCRAAAKLLRDLQNSTEPPDPWFDEWHDVVLDMQEQSGQQAGRSDGHADRAHRNLHGQRLHGNVAQSQSDVHGVRVWAQVHAPSA